MSQAVAVILAAGKGTRMQSDLPKVLFEVRGRPMIEYVLDAVERADIKRTIVVVGYRADLVREKLAHRSGLEFVDQTEQLGTGHAVKVCSSKLVQHQGPVVVLTGDSPMTQTESLRALLEFFQAEQPACLLGTLITEDPTGLGRIVRDEDDRFVGIVEQKDASAEQHKITEVNMSTYVFDCNELLHALAQLRDDNQQKEYYLTDCPGILKREGKDVRALATLKACEGMSINTVDELAAVEAEMERLEY